MNSLGYKILAILIFSPVVAFAQDYMSLCGGVGRNLGDSSCFSIQNACRLYVNNYNNVEISEINAAGEVINNDLTNVCLFDGKKNFENEYSTPRFKTKIRRNVDQMKVVGYRVDASQVRERQVDPERHILKNTKGVVVLNGLMLARNYDKYSMDGNEKKAYDIIGAHSENWTSFSVTMIPVSVFNLLLETNRFAFESEMKRKEPTFVYPNDRETLTSSKFIYSTSKKYTLERHIITRIIRNKIQERRMYNFANVTGPFFNRKNAIMRTFDSSTCEFYDCDTVGAQVLSYDGSNYGFIKWNDLTKNPSEEEFVVSVEDGDKSADRDDLMGLFFIKKETLASGNPVIYRQFNTRGGIDFILNLQLKK